VFSVANSVARPKTASYLLEYKNSDYINLRRERLGNLSGHHRRVFIMKFVRVAVAMAG
jgi:hypothetical protein